MNLSRGLPVQKDKMCPVKSFLESFTSQKPFLNVVFSSQSICYESFYVYTMESN